LLRMTYLDRHKIFLSSYLLFVASDPIFVSKKFIVPMSVNFT
jgi:hypothetical protein